MSVSQNLADAVTHELGETFAGQMSPRRRFLPQATLAELEQLQVTVTPRSWRRVRADAPGRIPGTRGGLFYDYAIDVGVQKKLSDIETDLPAMLDLVESIADGMRRRPLSQVPGVQCVDVLNEPVYDSDFLLNERAFSSVLTLVYRVLR